MIEKIRPNPYANSLVKRFFDLTMSFLGFLFFSPIIILISLSIKIGSKGPPFFIQERVGLNGKPFKTIMFRTMYMGAERDQKKYAHLNEADGPVFKINNPQESFESTSRFNWGIIFLCDTGRNLLRSLSISFSSHSFIFLINFF